jgi:tRNA(Ile)-lysidine synthase
VRLTRALPEVPDSILASFDLRLDRTSAAPVAVAYSGGGDSLFLLLAARLWAETCERPLLALHVDHRLQPQSSAWAEQARAVAAELGADFRLLPWTGEKPVTGLPAAARTARLTLMAEAAREAGAGAILLGHTANDVRESDLMRAEGSTLGGLSEWAPSPVWPQGRDLFHFRPLLNLSRDEIRKRLREKEWNWIEDPANEDLRYGRSRARAALSSALPGDPRLDPERDDIGQRLSLGSGLRRDLWGKFSNGVDAAVVMTFGREALHGSDDPPLKAALVCASGVARLPRSDRLTNLRDRLRCGDRFTATLAGARIEAGKDVLICRDAGEYARSGSPRLELAPGRAGVWDGRFEVACQDEGWCVMPLKGRAARLPKAQRDALRCIPAAARPTLPVLVNGAETVTCPLLAEVPGVRVRPLVATRLAGALGLIRTEAEAVSAAHGAGAVCALSWGG